MATYKLVTSDVVEWAKSYSGPQFHALFSDFPYDLGFMGKKWDTNAQFEAWGASLLPVLKPGALALVFGGTRTWHRLAVGMEDAGFEVWDTMTWLYGTGFPKAPDLGKMIGKRGDAANAATWTGYRPSMLKPGWEPIVCFKKSFEGKYVDTILEHGSGALNIEGSRVGDEELPETKAGQSRLGTFIRNDMVTPARTGRYPTNVLLDEEAAVMVGDQARFFYAAKSNPAERNAGMPEGTRNDHPTLKPVSLTTYIAKLLLPPASVGTRRIIVPFSGSGSEIIGCLMAGWDEVLGVELTPEYNVIAKYRCDHTLTGGYNKFL
jgi:site-specific DNA-methyltransferase (adenine-specific)